jgi:hypothetical protein
MQRLTRCVLALGLIAMAGCGGIATTRDLGLQDVQIVFSDFELQQGEVSRAQPVITVTPTLELTNPNDVPVTLDRIELQLKGPPELIQIDQRVFTVGREIAAGATIQQRLNIFATVQSSGARTVQLFPLFVSGRAFFRSARGSFSQGFVQRQQDEG